MSFVQLSFFFLSVVLFLIGSLSNVPNCIYVSLSTLSWVRVEVMEVLQEVLGVSHSLLLFTWWLDTHARPAASTYVHLGHH